MLLERGSLESESSARARCEPPWTSSDSTTDGWDGMEDGVSWSEGSSDAARLGDDVSEKEGSLARFCMSTRRKAGEDVG